MDSTKGRPRGRPFQKGTDPRRRGDGSAYERRAEGQTCPRCDDDSNLQVKGSLQVRHGVRGAFLGCSRWPECGYTQSINVDSPKPSTPVITKLPEPAVGSLDAIVAQIARAAAAQAPAALDETRVAEMLDAALQDQRIDLQAMLDEAVKQFNAPSPQTFEVKLGDLPVVELQGQAHKALARVLALAVARFNILLVGPAGCGKTTLGEQVAASLQRTFATISCAPGLPESALVGRLIPNLNGGDEKYRTTPFVEMYRNGGVFLLDEVDNADASTMLVLNSALANGHMTLPNGERVERHADFVLIASGNTYGHGQSREYVGRTQLDAAFLNRFSGATLSLDYDTDLERAVCPENNIRNAVQAVRDKARSLKLRRVVSTRDLLSARKLVLQLGDSLPAALQAITEGWTTEDRTACGVAV